MWVTFGWKVTLLYAIIAAGVSVLASIIPIPGFERHIIASKAHQQIVVLQPKLRRGRHIRQ
ncbi:hypothetical protein FA041_23915 [Escherichia coli]|nr:hypothetical protein [Escherichia coli]